MPRPSKFLAFCRGAVKIAMEPLAFGNWALFRIPIEYLAFFGRGGAQHFNPHM